MSIVNSFLTLVLLVFSFSNYAQEKTLKLETTPNYYRYDTDFLPASFHKARRDSLRKLLPEKSAAVFFANPERNRSNDVYFEYHQDPNFYYLTGLTEPNAMVVIYKEPQLINGEETNEILFMQSRNPDSEIWNGRRLGTENAAAALMFETIESNKNLKDFSLQLDSMKAVYYLPPYSVEEENFKKFGTTKLSGMYQEFEKQNSLETKAAKSILATKMAQLRQIKTPEEIVLLRKAIEITCSAQNKLMREITEGMAEYETEAIIEYEFKRSGAEYPGFPSIQGSGENSCILHYTSNRRPLINGGLLVSDVGAEYRGYTADVTRTIPPSGKFSKEEKLIYELVLKAQSAGIEACKEGASFWAAGIIATEIIAKGLVKLKIIKKEGDVKKYFMHGTSHYLGLDVHDAGLYTPLVAGNVITVEPGIYIAEGSDCDPKWWNIGVRIEDDILITKGDPENLSKSSPRTVKEIEALMAEIK